MPWELTGNPGTNADVHYLGTQDNQPLVIKTNNTERLRVTSDGHLIAGGNPHLKVRHVDGKDAVRDDNAELLLNWDTGQPVWVGRPDKHAHLFVHGNVGIGVTGPQQALSINSALNVDQADANNGSINPGITFGSWSGEGIASKRTTGGNQYGLDLYTWSTARLSITGPGNVGIGTTTPQAKLAVNGDVAVTGDIRLLGADYAEDFDVAEAEAAEPGTVMVIDQEGALIPSEQSYDKRVAGVVSGAEGYRPGIILDKQESEADRMPVALMGKVYCKVDARRCPIEVGDLLTTSSTPGHAMKANDPLKASGAVIGKALQPLAGGQGLIRVLVTLQ